MLICPVCGTELHAESRRFQCQKGHSFDIAKEGYVNLLRSGKNGDLIGDDKLSARSRRDFLNKGYYGILRQFLMELFQNRSGTLLDICCGEGYYTSAVGHSTLRVFGFDISKEMVRLAAKKETEPTSLPTWHPFPLQPVHLTMLCICLPPSTKKSSAAF